MVLKVNTLISDFVREAGVYAFAEVIKVKDMLKAKGVDIIDFGVGDPTDPTPEIMQRGCIEGVRKRARSGYPNYKGSLEYREAVASWFERRFGVELDPETEITATVGSKQAVFSFHFAYVNTDDVVFIPDPGYPPYTTGTLCRYGKPVHMPLIEENNFLPDLETLNKGDVKKGKILWFNYPNNPTTKNAPVEYLKEVVDFCSDNNILLASDEAYSEMYYDGKKKPISILEMEGARDISVVFNSLSKRSNATGYRIGFTVGEESLLNPFKRVQTQMHSGVATFIQDAAIVALSDEAHVEEMRRSYTRKREKLLNALYTAGFPEGKCYAESTFYVWAKTPEGYSSTDTTKKLLEEAGLNTTPGSALSKTNPPNGEGFVRFALVPSLERINEATKRLLKTSF